MRGSCVGTTILTKDLTLTGQQPPGFSSPTLDGAGQGSVLTITGAVAVTINTLTITGGGSTGYIGGGGIRNDQGGTVNLNGSSSITRNTATSHGGGIFNDAGGTVNLNGGTVTGNTPDDVYPPLR